MTLKELRRLLDRLDHKHDHKRVKVSATEGDYDLDKENTPVAGPDAVFLFIDPAIEGNEK